MHDNNLRTTAILYNYKVHETLPFVYYLHEAKLYPFQKLVCFGGKRNIIIEMELTKFLIIYLTKGFRSVQYLKYSSSPCIYLQWKSL